MLQINFSTYIEMSPFTGKVASTNNALNGKSVFKWYNIKFQKKKVIALLQKLSEYE